MASMNAEDAKSMLMKLHGNWQLSLDSGEISRKFKFKGFARAGQVANLIAWLGDCQRRHPDIAFGWGYCAVKFTTHEIGVLSTNDFICATKLDPMVDAAQDARFSVFASLF